MGMGGCLIPWKKEKEHMFYCKKKKKVKPRSEVPCHGKDDEDNQSRLALSTTQKYSIKKLIDMSFR